MDGKFGLRSTFADVGRRRQRTLTLRREELNRFRGLGGDAPPLASILPVVPGLARS